MTDPTTPIVPIGSSDSDITSIIPTGPIVMSNADFATTLPFKKSDVSREVRARILERTKQRWVWFSKAEDLDEERGTQLGTLGFLPWEIRQQIIEMVFRGMFHQWIFVPLYRRAILDNGEYAPRTFSDYFLASWRSSLPEFQSITYLRDASASTKVEVEYAFLTMTNFEFKIYDELIDFLDCLTTYQQSLLRSVTLQLAIMDNSNIITNNKAWMDVCARLPSGLTSVKFGLEVHSTSEFAFYKIGDNKVSHNVLGFMELLGKRIVRCRAPRAKLCTDREKEPWYDEVPNVEDGKPLASAFDDVEAWSKEWLEWWENSQDGAQTEVQSPLLSDHCDLS